MLIRLISALINYANSTTIYHTDNLYKLTSSNTHLQSEALYTAQTETETNLLQHFLLG